MIPATYIVQNKIKKHIYVYDIHFNIKSLKINEILKVFNTLLIITSFITSHARFNVKYI